MISRTRIPALLLPMLLLIGTAPALGEVNPSLLSGMKWRQIGPFRGEIGRAHV